METPKEKSGLSAEDVQKIRLLKPGMSVDMQVVAETVGKRVKSDFIGMDGTNVLIFRFPDTSKWGDIRAQLTVNTQLIIRFILEEGEGHVVAFKSRVTFILPEPIHLVFVTFPAFIQSQSLRSETRAQIRISVSIFSAETQKVLAMGKLVDMSVGGCRFITQRTECKKIQCQDIIIRLNGQTAERFQLQGSIVNIKQDAVSYSYGVKFTTSEVELGHLMNRLMLEV